LLDVDLCLTTISGVKEDDWDWDNLGVTDFSSASKLFGDMFFIVTVSSSSGGSDKGGDGLVDTTLGFRLGRVLKEVFVLLDVKSMLLSVSTGEVSSNGSVEVSVAKEALLLLEIPARVVFPSLFLELFFFFLLALRFWKLGFSAAAFSPDSDWTVVSAVAAGAIASSLLISEALATSRKGPGFNPVVRDLVGVATGVGRVGADVELRS